VRHKDQMPVPSPYQIVLSGEEEAVRVARARSVRSQYRDRLRARIVLAAAAGKASAAIAREVGRARTRSASGAAGSLPPGCPG
jgi:hypothetical protein